MCRFPPATPPGCSTKQSIPATHARCHPNQFLFEICLLSFGFCLELGFWNLELAAPMDDSAGRYADKQRGTAC